MNYNEGAAEMGGKLISAIEWAFNILKRLVNGFGCMFIHGHDYQLDYDEKKRARLRCTRCGHIKNI